MAVAHSVDMCLSTTPHRTAFACIKATQAAMCHNLICHLHDAPQGPRYSMPYFVNPKLNYVIQGPKKRWGPVTGFDMLSKTGGHCRTVCQRMEDTW